MPLRKPISVPEPRIFKYSAIGRNKFSKKLKLDPEINQKETALLILPGKNGIHEIARERRKKAVVVDDQKLENNLNNFFLKMHSKGILNFRNRARILHTHIMDYKKVIKGVEKFVALPSISDIKDLMNSYQRLRHGYEIIGVFDSKRNECGYTVIKINREKISKDNLKFIADLKENSQGDKEILYSRLSRMGLEIYFTPVPGYKLDRNFNYVKEK